MSTVETVNRANQVPLTMINQNSAQKGSNGMKKTVVISNYAQAIRKSATQDSESK